MGSPLECSPHVGSPLECSPHVGSPLECSPHVGSPLGCSPHMGSPLGCSPHVGSPLGCSPHVGSPLGCSPHVGSPLGCSPHVGSPLGCSTTWGHRLAGQPAHSPGMGYPVCETSRNNGTLFFIAAQHSFTVCPVHLPGRLNCFTAALSRNQISCFIFLAPQANHQYLKSWQSSRRPPETPPAQSCSSLNIYRAEARRGITLPVANST